MKKKMLFIIPIVIVIAIATGIVIYIANMPKNKLDEVLEEYFSLISQEKYEDLVSLVLLPNEYEERNFIARNKNIYQGIEANNIQIEIMNIESKDGITTVTYLEKMNIRGGHLEFQNTANLELNKDREYKIKWSSELIFPELKNEYKVRVSTLEASRGSLLDRNGKVLAGNGNVSSVGLVPGKLGEEKEANIEKVSKLLNVSTDFISNALSSSWVKDDSFVPLKTISYDETDLKQQLLQISGVMIDTKTDRVYPYKEATSHITGYVQGITAEELEKMNDSAYTASSIIGKAGLEKAYESRLKGTDGVKIYIEDADGKNIKTLVEVAKKDGENIKLTIDADLQSKIYDNSKENEGLFVVMNHQTGELLALVSTPSYDANKFVLGMTNDEWNSLLNREDNPLYTRFTQRWCPGSTFKPITGAIGLTSGKLSASDEFNYSGLSWAKDTWRDHKVTTLTSYNGRKNLRKALVYSDNIYFAQATLQIGEEVFTRGLNKVNFNEKIDFVLPLSKSIYSNSNTIASESILADSGFGQGEILVNPIHMASIYSAFVNDGNMIKPYIEYKENKTREYLVEGAFSKETANTIKEDLIQVVEDTTGTGHDVKVDGVTIGGKTGTAELKATGEENGDTLGWFDCFTLNDNPIVIISMAKNQKSTYLKSIIKSLF